MKWRGGRSLAYVLELLGLMSLLFELDLRDPRTESALAATSMPKISFLAKTRASYSARLLIAGSNHAYLPLVALGPRFSRV